MNVLFWVIAFSLMAFGFANYKNQLQKDAGRERTVCEEKKEAYLQDKQEGEEIKAFTALDLKNSYFCAVTDRRIVFDTNKGRVSLPYDQIKKVKYQALDGFRAKVAGDVYTVIIKANRNYKLVRKSAHFSEIPAALSQYC